MTSALKKGSLFALRRVACELGGTIRNIASVPKFFGDVIGGSPFLFPPQPSRSVLLMTDTMTSAHGSRNFSSKPARKDSLRIHAVSLYQGDYNDDDNEEGLWDDDSPADQKQTWHIDPSVGAKLDEQEEATWWLYDGTQESRDALAEMRKKEAQKNRWIQNSLAPVRVSEIDERGRAYGRGSRKTAQARVWIQPGVGEVVVNRREFVSYFPRESDREHVLGPLVATQTCGKFDVTATVQGGGLRGQAGAIRLGLARALEKYDPDFRPPMKRLGMMTRDPRMVERKKVGRVKARKSPQWVRR
mmetsp:Transcript_9147/g.19523  ORF Transcript_9147/g.19523 Transcript_9147/m.19523 type:complete len:301 (-) Transcript_9147:248-1150(-)|eukprot:CAMPEP_0171358918 /NCGR_PEP_ID=MMETSP0879-20121228/304_1 /TAXON_ID=67004 /ORGANISM="Thalassiosira weissflogii, Strain CCMP1336" /LENGTH=300 /DNA_ID=CAMNT_0011865039 /DNA_START=25 /DNA_END=927 /DNA_ORIENTATION=+